MNLILLISTVIKFWGEISKLILILEAHDNDQSIGEDLKIINDAFENKDAKKLRDLFSDLN